jgi:MFS family permease
MRYLAELRANPRPLIAASLGSGTSLPLFAYTNSVFAPYLVHQFGWSRSQFALIGLALLPTLLVLPLVGRVTDRFGVRRVASIGTALMPLCFVGYSLQHGSFVYFLAISMCVLTVGSFSSPLVYSRLVAENYRRSTGLALTIVNCMPALLAIGVVPLLNIAIARFGWRVAYLGMGALTLAGGIAALSLIPRGSGSGREPPAGLNAPDEPATPELHVPRKGDYRLILRNGTLWTIIVATFLCLLQTPLHASQMNMMLLDNGISTQAAANVVSVYALGTIIGRIGCGLALDRYATPFVASASMIAPAVGLFLLGSPWNGVPLITGAMFLIGLSVGAESDLLPFVVARYFKLRIYNTTLSLVFATTFLAGGIGSVLISATIKLSNSFSTFLYLTSGTALVGSLLFLLLPKARDHAQIG